MGRRKLFKEEETQENHERWLVSYADFITLLFAFFVVMYAVSSLNEGKYKVLSSSMVNAFKNPAAEANQLDTPQSVIEGYPDSAMVQVFDEPNTNAQRTQKREKMRTMAKNILQVMEPLIADGKVTVTQSNIGITVEINASVLFSPGEALMAEDSAEALRAVAKVVKGHDHEIHIEGHTDNIPIHTANFPSNWELSTARASSVIRLFVDNGVSAARLTAIGYGENRPVASNDTIEGRQRNRRVSIMILDSDPDQIAEIEL